MFKKLFISSLIVLFLMTSFIVDASEEVNVYSYRQPFLVEPLFNKFTEESGIKVNVVFAKKGMAERLAREGKYSPADILLTTDISRLIELRDKDLVQAVNSSVLSSAIPKQYQAQDNTWFALTTRVRNIYSAKRLGKIDLNYEDLADEKYKGRVCTRSGKHPNLLLFIF